MGVESNQGLCTETDYPYLAYQEWRCREDGCQKYDSISSYQDVSESTAALEAACNEGPVSIAIEADQSAFQQYESGVLTGYCRLCRNCDANSGKGQCGILLSASYPIV